MGRLLPCQQILDQEGSDPVTNALAYNRYSTLKMLNKKLSGCTTPLKLLSNRRLRPLKVFLMMFIDSEVSDPLNQGTLTEVEVGSMRLTSSLS
jgi:hypothetical protein